MRIIYLICLLLAFIVSSCKQPNYNINISSIDRNIKITVPAPRFSMSAIGSIDWDVDWSEIEKKIYNSLQSDSYNGEFNIVLIYTTKDKYGNNHIKEQGVIGLVNVEEVKKYTDYEYFKGNIQDMLSRWLFDMYH